MCIYRFFRNISSTCHHAIDLRNEHDGDSDANALSVSCPDMKRKSQTVPLPEIGGSRFANDARDLKPPPSLSLSLSLSVPMEERLLGEGFSGDGGIR